VDATAELPQHALELWPILALVRQRRDVTGKVVNDLQGAPHLPVPEVPLQAFKIAEKLESSERLTVGVAIASPLHGASGVAHAECELSHHREPHSDVEPIQDMLRLRTHAHLQIANGVTVLEALRCEEIVQTSLGLRIEAADKAEALRLTRRG
jgi:hypothetical protein